MTLKSFSTAIIVIAILGIIGGAVHGTYKFWDEREASKEAARAEFIENARQQAHRMTYYGPYEVIRSWENCSEYGTAVDCLWRVILINGHGRSSNQTIGDGHSYIGEFKQLEQGQKINLEFAADADPGRPLDPMSHLRPVAAS